MRIALLKNAMVYQNNNLILKDVFIENGRFSLKPESEIDCAVIDASGLKVFPGIVDVHNDSIERLIVPMKNTFFLNENTIHEMIARNFCNGITSFYFSMTVSSEPGVRSLDCFNQFVNLVSTIRNVDLYKDNIKIQMRYEITHDAQKCINDIDFSNIDMICLNDHSPDGLSGWSKEKSIRNINYRYDLTDNESTAFFLNAEKGKKLIPYTIELLLSKAYEYNIPVGIHDVSDLNQLEIIKMTKFDFAEFPLNKEMCRYFSENGTPVILGAPNVILGHSRTNNISVREAVSENICNILCSDYHHSSLLMSPFSLNQMGILPLIESWKLVSSNPALFFNLTQKGSIDIGKDADFIIIDDRSSTPQVVATFIKGEKVYENKVYFCNGDKINTHG